MASKANETQLLKKGWDSSHLFLSFNTYIVVNEAFTSIMNQYWNSFLYATFRGSFGNLGIGMSASASALASTLAFEYKDCILQSMNCL